MEFHSTSRDRLCRRESCCIASKPSVDLYSNLDSEMIYWNVNGLLKKGNDKVGQGSHKNQPEYFESIIVRANVHPSSIYKANLIT